MGYPYYKNYVDKKKILEDFQKLKDYKPKIKNSGYQNSKVFFLENYNTINRVTDYFSEDCRVKCSFRNNPPPIEKFKEIKDLVKPDMSYEKIDKILYENIKNCSNLNTTLIISVFKFLKPTKVLDFSSGWGDRLIASMAYGCEYTGVDPSNCMYKRYENMIKTLGGKNKKDYKVHKKGFEDFKVEKSSYDLVFTSPPFFDLEIYEDSETQSVKRFNTIEDWKKGFLFPSLKKSFIGLEKEGYLAIYVSDYTLNGKRVSYVNDMKNYIRENLKMKYYGTINWQNTSNVNSVIRKIYVWKK